MSHDTSRLKYQNEMVPNHDAEGERKGEMKQEMDTDEQSLSSAPYPDLISGISVYCEGVDSANKMFSILKVRSTDASTKS